MKSSTLDSTPALLQGSVLIFMLFSNLTIQKQMLCAAYIYLSAWSLPVFLSHLITPVYCTPIELILTRDYVAEA
jgi:hypothetical protein